MTSNGNPCLSPKQPNDECGDMRWISIHRRFLQECVEKDPEILFVGDDILESLSFTEIYSSFEDMHLLNFSIRGDLIENVLWRLKNDELKNIRPKVVVIHVGTNNAPTNTVDEIAEGIIECVNVIKESLPNSFIVVTSLLPRGQFHNVLREKNAQVNELLRMKLQGMLKVQYIDITKGIIQKDQSISHHVLFDYMNVTNAASKNVFEPLWDLLNQILNENEKSHDLTPSE